MKIYRGTTRKLLLLLSRIRSYCLQSLAELSSSCVNKFWAIANSFVSYFFSEKKLDLDRSFFFQVIIYPWSSSLNFVGYFIPLHRLFVSQHARNFNKELLFHEIFEFPWKYCGLPKLNYKSSYFPIKRYIYTHIVSGITTIQISCIFAQETYFIRIFYPIIFSQCVTPFKILKGRVLVTNVILLIRLFHRIPSRENFSKSTRVFHAHKNINTWKRLRWSNCTKHAPTMRE